MMNPGLEGFVAVSQKSGPSRRVVAEGDLAQFSSDGSSTTSHEYVTNQPLIPCSALKTKPF